MGANDKQVGGTHYRSVKQLWDLIGEHYGPAYFIAAATKYVTRHRKKNGAQDLEKAAHYIEKLKELYLAKSLKLVNGPSCAVLNEWYRVNDFGAKEERICTLVFQAYSAEHLQDAINLINELIAEY
jgi:hypothetical protein